MTRKTKGNKGVRNESRNKASCGRFLLIYVRNVCKICVQFFAKDMILHLSKNQYQSICNLG